MRTRSPDAIADTANPPKTVIPDAERISASRAAGASARLVASNGITLALLLVLMFLKAQGALDPEGSTADATGPASRGRGPRPRLMLFSFRSNTAEKLERRGGA